MQFQTLNQDVTLNSVFFKELGELTQRFLRDNGADRNGMNTYIKGFVNQTDSNIEVMTPQLFDNCVIPEIMDKGAEFAETIQGLARQYNLQDTVEFVSNEIDEGKYSIELRVIVSVGGTVE